MRTEIASQVRPAGSRAAPAKPRNALKPFDPGQISGATELNRIFRSGEAPNPRPSGFYSGALVTMQVMRLLDPALAWIVQRWRPWHGKTFTAEKGCGMNVVSKSFRTLAGVMLPGYQSYTASGPTAYQAFPFVTYLAPGLKDTDRQVLKIDYNLDINPRLTVRRILDELVQLEDGFYLGKAHVQWWWGSWQTVAFFTLTRPPSRGEALPQTMFHSV